LKLLYVFWKLWEKKDISRYKVILLKVFLSFRKNAKLDVRSGSILKMKRASGQVEEEIQISFLIIYII